MRVKKLIKLINSERIHRNIVSEKATDCSGYSTDICNVRDFATCTVNSYDVCGKDYAGCYNNSYDYCSYKDTDACGSNGYDYN